MFNLTDNTGKPNLQIPDIFKFNIMSDWFKEIGQEHYLNKENYEHLLNWFEEHFSSIVDSTSEFNSMITAIFMKQVFNLDDVSIQTLILENRLISDCYLRFINLGKLNEFIKNQESS